MNLNKSIVLAVAMAALVAVMSFSVTDTDGADQEYDQDLGVMYGYVMQFVFTGSDALSVTWDFGDGSDPVTDWNPQHTYAEKGVYYITQDAYNTFNGGSHAIAVYKITIAGYPWIDFDTTGGSDVARIQMQSAGQNAVAAEKPADPVREGYDFDGWYTDEACTQPYDWTKKVTEAVTLYAGWTLQSHTVSFNLDGGSGSIATQTVEHGSAAAEPADPVREGYIFTGWYDGDDRWSFTSPVLKDMTLTAHWTAVSPGTTIFKITFDGDGGVIGQSSASCEEGCSITLPDASREGFRFAGWYDGDIRVGSTGDPFAPTKDVTLTAHWSDESGLVDGEDEDEGFPLWILLAILTAICAIALFVTRSPVALTITAIAAVATVLSFAGVI